MKWYNKHKTKMIDLDKVCSFQFEERNDELCTACKLDISICGTNEVIYGKEAEEIYNILTSEREVI